MIEPQSKIQNPKPKIAPVSEEIITDQEAAPPVVPLKKRMERGAGAIALRVIVGPLRAMPLPMARKCGRAMGTALYYLLGRYRRVAIKNLTLVYGQEKSHAEIVGMAKDVFRNFGETAVEFVKLPQLGKEQIESLAVVEGHENFAEAMAMGRGILMISGHFGNWEFMSRYVTLLGYKINVVVRDARDPVATKLLADTRTGYGVNILYRGGSARSIYSLLKKNQMVGLLPDQNAADVFVPFFGFRTGTVNGPAALHLLTKAPIMFVWCTRMPDGRFRIVAEPPVMFEATKNRDADIAAITALINARLEARIRENPTQWLWLHDRWKASPGVFPDSDKNYEDITHPRKRLRDQAARESAANENAK